eukprot:1304894-Prymnesium_polylepis.1
MCGLFVGVSRCWRVPGGRVMPAGAEPKSAERSAPLGVICGCGAGDMLWGRQHKRGGACHLR